MKGEIGDANKKGHQEHGLRSRKGDRIQYAVGGLVLKAGGIPLLQR